MAASKLLISPIASFTTTSGLDWAASKEVAAMVTSPDAAQTQADEMAELSEQLEDLEPSPSPTTSRTAGEDLG